MNNSTAVYLEYIKKVCPTLEAEWLSKIVNCLENTSWEEPNSATDFNNIAVVALIEAEACKELSLRTLYLEIADEALNKGIELEGHPLCAAHLSMLMSMTGQMQKAWEFAWYGWLAALNVQDSPLDETSEIAIIYIPNKYHNFTSDFSKKFAKILTEEHKWNQYIMILSEALCRSFLVFYSSMGLRLLQVAVQVYPDSMELNFKLGVSSITNKQWEGIFYLHRASHLAAEDPRILQAIYLAYRDLGNLSLASKWFDRACQLRDRDPDDIKWQWTNLTNNSNLTYALFDEDILLAVEASFNSLVTSVLIAEGDWFETEMEFWRNWVKPGMTVIDVGANVGVYTFSAARRVGNQGKVLAVEPFSGCVRCLEETCRLNQLSWVKVCAGAASDRQGKARLSLCESSELNELVTDDHNPEIKPGTFEEVQCFTLDSLIEKESLNQVDIVKIDAEGHELSVLAGSEKILSEFAPVILYENIAGSKGSNLQVANYLISKGYQLFRYQPYIEDLIPIEDTADLQGNLNVIALPESKVTSVR